MSPYSREGWLRHLGSIFRPKMAYVLFLLIVLTAFIPTNRAQAGDLEITPLIGYTFGGGFENVNTRNSLNLVEGQSAGVIIGVADKNKPGAFYEFLYHHQSTGLNGDGQAFAGDPHFGVDIDYFHLGGRYGLVGEKVNPFMSGGLGVTHMNPEVGGTETKFSFSLGGGVNIPLSERIGLRLEARGFGTLFDGRSSIFCSNNGCAVQVTGDLMWQFSTFSAVAISF